MPKMEPKTTRRRAALEPRTTRTASRPAASGSRASWRPEPAGLAGAVERGDLAARSRRAARPRAGSAATASAASRPLLIAGPMPSPERSRASPAASPTRQKRGPESRRGACAAHDVGVALERLDGQLGGQPPGRAQSREQARRAGAAGCRPLPPVHADADVQEVLLGEVPAVAAKVRLDVELRRVHERPQPLRPLRRQARLALLGGDHALALGHLAERLAPPGSGGRPRR